MPEEKLIDPGWLIKARQRRKTFVLQLAVVFVLLTVLAWWILPTFAGKVEEIRKAVPVARGGKAKAEGEKLPAMASLLISCVGVFKVFWAGIAIGCGAAGLLALTGKIDTLLPVLNWVVLAVGLGTVVLSFYILFLPMLTMVQRVG